MRIKYGSEFLRLNKRENLVDKINFQVVNNTENDPTLVKFI
jgi:hypothetical protein